MHFLNFVNGFTRNSTSFIFFSPKLDSKGSHHVFLGGFFCDKEMLCPGSSDVALNICFVSLKITLFLTRGPCRTLFKNARGVYIVKKYKKYKIFKEWIILGARLATGALQRGC